MLQLSFQLQEGQLLTFQIQILLQLSHEQEDIGLVGSWGIIKQLSQLQELQLAPEQGGTMSSGQEIPNPHHSSQTWKSQVEEIIQLESWTNR